MPPPRRLWLFRFAAIAVGLLPFVFAELACLAFDWGRPTDHDDPFVGFSDIHPLFVLDDVGDRYEIPKSRLKFFHPESFPARKSENTFRIFVLGGSTVAGEPYANETSFPAFLQLALVAADPSKDWQVVNCGGISYASYRLVPILKECLAYQPDLFILASGHNEFLEDRTYTPLKNAPVSLAWIQGTFSRLRTFTLLRSALPTRTGQESGRRETSSRAMLPTEVDALLDHRGGLDLYHRDEEYRADIVRHFDHNIRRMIALAQTARVPLILVQEPSNLRDSPPFKSEHRADLSDDDRHRFESLIEEARALYPTDLPRAARLLTEATRLDDRHALAWYELGNCLDRLRDFNQARRAYLRAREEDVCPLRMIQPLEDALLAAAADTNTPLLDLHTLFESRTKTGILGDDWLVDHVHPSIEGHQVVADALLDELTRLHLAATTDDWEARKDAAFRAHVDALPPEYLTRAQQTLEALRGWTKGRADAPLRPQEMKRGNDEIQKPKSE